MTPATPAPQRQATAWLGLILGLLLGGATPLAAMTTDAFRDAFIRNYDAQAFDAQVELVKNNPTLIPDAIRSLTDDAMRAERGFEARMYLLNIASAMAYMHRHWHGDEAPLHALEPIIKTELEHEQQRLAVLMKWKKEESILGNFVMKQHEAQMREQDLAPVLYPHWMHRILFECKVCHDSIFRMKRWDNKISHQEILAGRQCGTCHNGQLAFDAKENCVRCHVAGRPEAERLHHPEKVDMDKLREAAARVGAEWHPEKLPGGKLPLDRFQFVDWLALKQNGAFTPLAALQPGGKEETRDNRILFKSNSDFVSDVIFDHKIHSDWIQCSTCHPAIFKEDLGGNRIKMTDMAGGQFCGHCHGKVSFTFADCLRCHKQTNGKLDADQARLPDLLRRTIH